jgi:hypothetical protein
VSGKATMKNFKAMLAGAKLAEKSVPICLRGDLVADHEAAERELEVAQKKPADSLDGTGVGAIVDRIEALEAEMREHTYDFRLRAMHPREYRALQSEHPPRRDADGNIFPQDGVPLMFNRETFPPTLIRKCTIDPVLDDDDWRRILGDSEEEMARLTTEGKADEIEQGILNDRQLSDLEDAAFFLNRGEVDVPFSRAASLAKRNSSGE